MATSFGIQLKDAGLKLSRSITIRALAIEVKVDFRLKGASTFWLSTRGKSLEDPDAVICRLAKEEESQRVFLEYGSLSDSGKFLLFKRMELPEKASMSEDAIACDFTNVHLHFIDNGDTRVFVQLRSSTSHPEKDESKRRMQSSCGYFVPCLETTQLTMFGSGESVEVSAVRARYVERLLQPTRTTSERKECCGLL